MGSKFGYDLDGVLAVQPPDTGKPWRKMNGQERAAKRAWLVEWYRNAPRLFTPTQIEIVVITARRATPENKAVTEDWLRENLPLNRCYLHMLDVSRSIENVLRFKSGVIIDNNLTDYIEDNRQVVRGLRPLVPSCRVWHFKDGKQILDYDAPITKP